MVDRKLGRGLDFFLSGGRSKAASSPVTADRPGGKGLETSMVEVGLLGPNPNQPRKVMAEGELKELAASLRTSGMLQPILVRRVGQRFEIVAGERRWRAAQQAGLDQVPVLIKDVTDEESAVFALVENLQREDLNAIEKAKAFQELKTRFRASQEVVAQRVGLDRSTVANFVRLLELAPPVQEHVSRGTLTMGHARALLGIRDVKVQIAMADEALRQGMSVRALEALVREQLLGENKESDPAGSGKAKKPGQRAAWLKEIEETLTDNLSTTVGVRFGRKKSVIQIECAGREEFERIYSRLKEC